MWNLRRRVVRVENNEQFGLDVVSVRLVKDAPVISEHPVNNPKDAVSILGKLLCELDREVVCIVNLKTDGTPINCHFASMGSLNESLVHPRELFKASILSNAANMLIIHNHPSGKLIPSMQDTMMTDRMAKMCKLMGIPLVDHIIVGGDSTEYFSFMEKDLIKELDVYLSKDYKTLDIKPVMVAEKEKAR